MIIISIFSGKCDLADFVAGMGGWFDKHGNPVTYGQDDVSIYYSDFYRDFEAFKKATGGVLHQHIKLNKLDDYAVCKIAERHKDLIQVAEHSETILNPRKKGELKTKIFHTYLYYGKEYTLKELNKHGVYLPVEIHFDNMLDLIPYLPYLVTMSVCSEGKQTVFISNESYAETEYKELLECGCDGGMINYYRKALSDFYFKVCQHYMLYNLENRICLEVVSENNLIKDADGDYLFKTTEEIDTNHSACFVFNDENSKIRWGNPVILNNHTIKIDALNVEDFLKEDIKNHNIKLKYIKYPDEGFPIYLD